jgi:uncharacterized protein YndB with AHSA1/START domain
MKEGRGATMEGSITINRPVEEVFAYVTDIGNLAKWNEVAGQGEQTSQGPVGVGTTYRGVADFMGREMEWTSEVTEYEPNRKVAQKMNLGPTVMAMSWLVEPVEGGTKFTIRSEGEMGGLAKLVGPLLDRTMKKQMEGNLAKLKALLEG